MKARMPGRERHISKKEMDMAVEVFLRMAMLVLIEDFGFGTRPIKGKVSRLQKFITAFENQAQRMNMVFDKEMFDGINARLQMHGVMVEDKTRGVRG